MSPITYVLCPVPPDPAGSAEDSVITPVVAMLSADIAPALPTFNTMLSVVPTPLVDCNVSDDPAAVPPRSVAAVSDVSVGVAENAGAPPEPVSTVPLAPRAVDAGAAPAPPPYNTPLAVSNPLLAQVLALLK